MTREDDFTRLVERSRAGDRAASEQLLPLIYDQLRGLARRYMAAERPDHTLQPTALVHEAYVRLAGGGQDSWENRAHFFAAASTAVRRILVEHARSRRNRPRRDPRTDGLDAAAAAEASDADVSGERVLLVDEALRRLANENPQMAKLVELRFFGGLVVDDAAAALGMSPRTAAREWAFTKAWLARELREELGLDD
jgi:RNA polymerase sigma factor (TIGR02999 family)